MRDQAKWMNSATIPVLELLAEYENLALPGTTIALNLDRIQTDAPSESTVYRALTPLHDRGLIRAIGSETTHYMITDRGLGYLEGKIDASDLDIPEQD